MTHYDIRYEANNSYQHVVNEALFEFSVLPATTDTQLVNDVRIENSLDVPVFSSRNVFGYEVLFCRIAQPFTHLTFSVSCTVRRSTQRVLPNTSEMPAESGGATGVTVRRISGRPLPVYPANLADFASGKHTTCFSCLSARSLPV